jgi:archaellum component FlaF (FlaF/FlaG flagellin family)
VGLDTTTTHLVWFVAIVTVAGSAAHGLIATSERLQDARDAWDARLLEKLDTKLGSATYCYNSAAQRLNATALNLGGTLNASEVTLVADGVVVASQNVNVWGAAGQSVWRQNEYASWNRSPMSQPSRLVIYAGNGVAALATLSFCPEDGIHVAAMATYKSGVASSTFGFSQTVETRVTIQDYSGSLVSGATVRLVLTDPNGAQQSNTTAITNAGGIAFFNYTIPPGAKKGTWTDEVMGLSHAEKFYDPTVNVVRLITFTVS